MTKKRSLEIFGDENGRFEEILGQRLKKVVGNFKEMVKNIKNRSEI